MRPIGFHHEYFNTGVKTFKCQKNRSWEEQTIFKELLIPFCNSNKKNKAVGFYEF